MFDATITLGNLLTVISFLTIGLIYIVTIKKDAAASALVGEIKFNALHEDFRGMKDELKKVSACLGDMAVQEQRINRIEDRQLDQGKRIDEIHRVMNSTQERINRILDANGHPPTR